MINYAIFEINGKQFKIIPNQEIEIDRQKDSGDLNANILLVCEDGNLRIGKPYLKEKLNLKNAGDSNAKKIRVAKFHAKANYRKVTGSRARKTKVVLSQ